MSHPFDRPPLVRPDLPPFDACLRCGRPEAEHEQAPARPVTLTAREALTVLGALDDAARCGDEHGQYGGPDDAAVAAYRALARSLGDDR